MTYIEFTEIAMLVLFGVSWPFNIAKSYKSRTAKGKSVIFEFIVIIGYLFGSIIFFVGLPPRNVLICYAPLDRMEKQCCSFITDGEELKNNLLFLRQAT